MRNLLALIGLAVVVFLGAGYYFGWYSIDMSKGIDGKQHINLEVDTKKIGTDTKNIGEKVAEKGGDAVDNLKKSNGDTHPDLAGPLSATK